MRPSFRSLLFACLGAYLLIALIPLCLALVLLFTAETGAGYVFSIDALLLLALPFTLARGLLVRRAKRFRPLAINAAVASLLYGVLVMLSPPGEGLAGSGVATRWLGKPYPRYSIANLLPEIDQVKLGTWFVPFMDPIITRAAAAHIREVTLAVYRPTEKLAAFRPLGSSMAYAYSDEDSGHLYEYVPKHSTEEKLPAVVFLHGSGGNFKAYLYIWIQMAEAQRFIVVAPSFGFGNWYEPGGAEAVERARQHAIRSLGADPERIYLSGLSNGGLGVGAAMASTPPGETRYRGVILLSAVPAEQRDDSSVSPGWRGMPVLVVHGGKDDRIPWAAVEEFAASLTSAGAQVTVRVDPGEDHFLMFSRQAEVIEWVGAWLKERLSTPTVLR